MARKRQVTEQPNILVVSDKSQIPEGANIAFAPEPGPQTEAYLAQEHTVLYGGARGGGKTHISIGKSVAGNPFADQSLAWNVSYVYHPGYRALVLRRNYKDLLDYRDRASQLYEAFGGQWIESRKCFEFPSGAKVSLGHLDDESSYQIYQGQQYMRIFIEEVTQIKSKVLYDKVVMSCRSPFPELKAQVFLTANPDGPGFGWVKQMFMFDPRTGKRVPPRTVITEEFSDPRLGKIVTDRVFIPSTVWDNPHILRSDPNYVARLMSLPDALRRAYLDGDWDAVSGSTFFSEFRKNGPLVGEPEWANHCCDSSEVFHMPWYRMWCGMDWAYGHYSAIYWFFENPQDHRIYVCDELRVTGMGSYDLGMEFGRKSLKYLNADDETRKAITVYMSPDAWHKRDSAPNASDLSTVARFTAGANYVMGSNSVYVPSAEEIADHDRMARIHVARKARIVVVPAPNHRVTGWDHCRELLNWRPALVGDVEHDDREYVAKLMQEPDWQTKYIEYIKARSMARQEQVLPRMRIMRDRCPWLISGIENAVFAENRQDVEKVDAIPQEGLQGDDEIDAWRYGCSGWTRERKVMAPIGQRWMDQYRQVLDAHPDAPPGALAMSRMQLWAKEQKAAEMRSRPVHLARKSSTWGKPVLRLN